jgi:hypothetical protein
MNGLYWVGGSLCNKIGVKIMWHDFMLRKFKLMTFIEFYLYSYIGLWWQLLVFTTVTVAS